MKILLLSDIHGNYPALEAVAEFAPPTEFDLVCNCGDSTVYGPFPNECLDWLQQHRAVSILGNTDRKILRLIKGKKMKKPGKAEKRIMYTSTVDVLTQSSMRTLQSFKKKKTVTVEKTRIGLFHGSPDDPDEFLFPSTEDKRFQTLAGQAKQDIICFGHSHTPFYKHVKGVHFINPGSVGRMFDGNPAASFAVLTLKNNNLTVFHHRVPWEIEKMSRGLQDSNLPSIYIKMYEQGLKLN